MAEHKSDFPKQDALISFESGHYKSLKNAEWKGDSVWCHFKKKDGGMVHFNKDKIEYIETWQPKNIAKAEELEAAIKTIEKGANR